MTARRLEPTEHAVSDLGPEGALAFMAHELRTPLTAIIGMAELLKDSQLSPDQRDMVEVLNRSARGLVEIVSGVLDLAKLEAGKMELESRPFSPRECVEECIGMLSLQAAQQRIELAFLVDADVPLQVRGDAARLRQVLVNLVGNALKFTPGGEVVVSVSRAAIVADRVELRFSVTDSGTGIPADRLAAIFEPFAQADATTTRRFGGTGLGLPITRHLVTLMGGQVWVESELGEGSTFRFTTPVEVLEAAATPRPDSVLAGCRVLIVDDNVTVGELLRTQLAHWGAVGTLRLDVECAVVTLRESDFDLVLVDGDLTGVAGLAVTSVLQRSGRPRIPCVLMSTLGRAASPAEAAHTSRSRARFAAHLSKPITPRRLRDALLAALASAQSDGQVRAAVITPHSSRVIEPASGAHATAPATADPDTPEARLRGVRVLVVDDDPGVRRALERSLARAGAEVRQATDGLQALDAVKLWSADTVLLDAGLPGMDGYEVCRRLKADPRTLLLPVLMVSGFDGRADRLRVVDAGADGFLHKPFDREELLARLHSLARLKRATDRLENAEAVLVAMARWVDGKDPSTHGRSERLSDYAARLAARLGMDAREIEALRLAGLVHDVGKVSIPDAILLKPSALDDQEWHLMRTHPIEGERICSGLPGFRDVLPIIRHHHEKLDGTGYPDRLAGSAIPAAARVLQVVDVYDALTNARPYKYAESIEGAFEIMEREVGLGWWDPTIFSAFRDLVREDSLRSVEARTITH